MFTFFMILGAIMLCAAPVLLIISLVLTICKKKPRKWWLAFVTCIFLFFVFEMTASIFDCKHEYKITDELSPTCTEEGYLKYHCDKCDRDKTDYFNALGHEMTVISKTEPTLEQEGKIVERCERCGYEEVETIAKKIKEPIQDELPTSDQAIDKPTNNISKIQQAFIDIGYTESESIQIESVLSEIGITKCKVTTADEETADGMRVVACVFNDPGKDGYFATVNGRITTIGSSEEIWYDSEQGGVLSQFPDTFVSSDAEIILMQIAKDVAIQIAQNPSTVKFSTLEWGFARDGLTYAVQGTFSCSNLMGVSEKHTLQVWCESSEDYAKIQPYKVIMDGTVLIDNTAN